MSDRFSHQHLARALRGDRRAIALLERQPHDAVLEAAGMLPGLVLRADAVRAVLLDLRDGRLSPDSAQRWASFVRRGYVSDGGRQPLVPIHIEYESGAEDDIVEGVARLDELGDAVDGEIDEDESARLIARLSEHTTSHPVAP